MKNAIGLLILSAAVLSAQPMPLKPVFTDVPASARAVPNPILSDTDAVTDGMKAYQQRCAACHGPAGGGSKTAPALTNSDMRTATPGEIFWVISNGVVRYGMPSWSVLPERQRWQIVAYLKSLSPTTAKGTVAPVNTRSRGVFSNLPEKVRAKCNPLTGDAQAVAAGSKLFQQHCSQCHGTAGQGRRKAPPLISAEMMAATPGEIFSVLTNGIVRHGMPSWSRLPEVQRWQIVTFLESRNHPPNTPAGGFVAPDERAPLATRDQDRE